jgi:hypothetical protein
MMDKGQYRRFTCAACATVATFAALHLVYLDGHDVVVGADSHSHLEQSATVSIDVAIGINVTLSAPRPMAPPSSS